MKIHAQDGSAELGRRAAAEGADAIRSALDARGRAAIVVATGASQFETLKALVKADLDWSRVTAFHLDEYAGLGPDHPASFRRYLRERFASPIGTLGTFVEVQGDAEDLETEIARLNDRISAETIDVCFAGIGENCHLAFNDPPADFDTTEPYLSVRLDEACRRQQLGEGWFASLEEVPEQAISMSIRQIMKARRIVLSVPDLRKARAVADAVEGHVTNLHPASVLQDHPACSLHLDPESASLLQVTGALTS